MKTNLADKLVDWALLLKLSIRVQLGHRYWAIVLGVLIWPLLQAVMLLVIWTTKNFTAVNAQNFLIGFPLYCLAIGMGIRIIAGEIEQRTLEANYTIPEGAQRVWVSKLIGAVLLILCAEILLVVSTALFFTSFSIGAVYGAFQGAVFYLMFAMWIGALVKSELTSVLLALATLFINLNITDTRWSPLFNPLELENIVSSELLAWTIQNRVGFIILSCGLALLAFSRAERREQLLGK